MKNKNGGEKVDVKIAQKKKKKKRWFLNDPHRRWFGLTSGEIQKNLDWEQTSNTQLLTAVPGCTGWPHLQNHFQNRKKKKWEKKEAKSERKMSYSNVAANSIHWDTRTSEIPQLYRSFLTASGRRKVRTQRISQTGEWNSDTSATWLANSLMARSQDGSNVRKYLLIDQGSMLTAVCCTLPKQIVLLLSSPCAQSELGSISWLYSEITLYSFFYYLFFFLLFLAHNSHFESIFHESVLDKQFFHDESL